MSLFCPGVLYPRASPIMMFCRLPRVRCGLTIGALIAGSLTVLYDHTVVPEFVSLVQSWYWMAQPSDTLLTPPCSGLRAVAGFEKTSSVYPQNDVFVPLARTVVAGPF